METKPEPAQAYRPLLWWQRYLWAIALLFGAWFITRRAPPESWLIWLGAIGWAGYLMREVAMVALWLIGVGLLVWAAVWFLGALSAVPIGAAILVGAFLIASAVSRASKG